MTSTSLPQATPTCSTEFWTSNSRGQSPCSIAGALAGVCTGFNSVLPLLPGVGSGRYFYPEAGNIPGMGNATRCVCNTVYYALESACAACQDGSNRWYPWSHWSSKCNATYRTYPESVPSDVVIPTWAYLDVVSIGQFDRSLAKSIAEAESTSVVQHSATSTAPMKTTSAASMSSSPTETANPKPGMGGVIVWGVIVGIFPGIFLLGLAVCAVQRWRKRRTQAEATQGGIFYPSNVPDQPDYGMGQGGSDN